VGFVVLKTGFDIGGTGWNYFVSGTGWKPIPQELLNYFVELYYAIH
jgi:hypothetical protein